LRSQPRECIVRAFHAHRPSEPQGNADHVLDARDQSIIGEEEFTHLWQLSDDALASTTALLKYLIGPK